MYGKMRSVRATTPAGKKECVTILSMCVYVCVFVTLVIEHAMRMHHIVIHGLSSSTVLFHIIPKKERSSGEER